MNERPDLNKDLDAETFRSFYYLKEELIRFCRENNLPVSGGKIELTDRIACFFDTGRVLETSAKRKKQETLVRLQRIQKLNLMLYVQKSIEHFLWKKSVKVFLLMLHFRNG